MNSFCKNTRRKIDEMPGREEYERLLDRAKLKPIERIICDMKYLEGYNLAFIGDKLGYSESWIKRVHGRALKKLSKII